MTRNTLTTRQIHANNLSYIADYIGEYERKFTFAEAQGFADQIELEIDQGYPAVIAVQRAWDCLLAGRRGAPLWV